MLTGRLQREYLRSIGQWFAPGQFESLFANEGTGKKKQEPELLMWVREKDGWHLKPKK
jgi:hypothetical protein